MMTISEGANVAVSRAIEAAGGAKQLAAACGVSVQAVYKWLENGVTAERAIQIEGVTHGKVTRRALRPDLYPAEQAA